MYTNQLMMGALVHTIKTKFINKFSPPGGCLLLKETVITGRRRGGAGRGTNGCCLERWRRGGILLCVYVFAEHALRERVCGELVLASRSCNTDLSSGTPQGGCVLLPSFRPPLSLLLLHCSINHSAFFFSFSFSSPT